MHLGQLTSLHGIEFKDFLNNLVQPTERKYLIMVLMCRVLHRPMQLLIQQNKYQDSNNGYSKNSKLRATSPSSVRGCHQPIEKIQTKTQQTIVTSGKRQNYNSEDIWQIVWNYYVVNIA